MRRRLAEGGRVYRRERLMSVFVHIRAVARPRRVPAACGQREGWVGVGMMSERFSQDFETSGSSLRQTRTKKKKKTKQRWVSGGPSSGVVFSLTSWVATARAHTS